MVLKFVVPGEPVAKGRPKFTTAGGFGRAYTPAKTRAAEDRIEKAFLNQCDGNYFVKGEEVSISVEAFFQIPKSARKKDIPEMEAGHIRPTKKPDIDNVLKAVQDALNGIAYDDDSQIVSVSVKKYWSQEPRTVVWIRNER